MMIRAVPVVDRLARNGRELVLVGGEVVLVSEIASAILRACLDWTTIADVAAAVVEEFGSPEGVNAEERVENAASELEGHGLVEIRRDSHHIDGRHA